MAAFQYLRNYLHSNLGGTTEEDIMANLDFEKNPEELSLEEKRGEITSRRFSLNIASKRKVSSLLDSGWLNREIAHTSPIVIFGSGNHPWDFIFKEMLFKSGDIRAGVDRVKSTIITLPREIKPAKLPGESKVSDGALEAVALCKEQVDKLSSLNTQGGNMWVQMMDSILDNIFQGTSFTEVEWCRKTNLIREVEGVPMHHFAFERMSSGGALLRLRRPGKLIPIPEGKIVFSRNSIRGWPWGKPLADSLFYLWKSMIYNWQGWAGWLDRWSEPTPDVEWDPVEDEGEKNQSVESKTENDQREQIAISAADIVHGGGSFVHNPSVRLKLLQATVAGGDQFLTMYRHLAQIIARVLLHEIMTSGLEQEGSLAKAKVMSNISDSWLRYLSSNLPSVIRSTVFRWIVEVNLPGAPIPHYVVNALNSTHYARMFAGLAKALEVGMDVPEGYAKMLLNIPDVEPGEELLAVADVATGNVTTNDIVGDGNEG